MEDNPTLTSAGDETGRGGLGSYRYFRAVRDLLEPARGIFVVWRRWDETLNAGEVVAFRWCCKGECDRKLKTGVRAGFDFEQFPHGERRDAKKCR